MDTQTIIKRNPDLLAVDMDGETVMMDMESGNYFGINAVGSHIWTELEADKKVTDIITSVQSHFDVQDGDDLQGDILTFLNDMMEQKLIETVAT